MADGGSGRGGSGWVPCCVFQCSLHFLVRDADGRADEE